MISSLFTYSPNEYDLRQLWDIAIFNGSVEPVEKNHEGIMIAIAVVHSGLPCTRKTL